MTDEEIIKEIIERAESEEGQRIADEVLARCKRAASDKKAHGLKDHDINKKEKL